MRNTLLSILLSLTALLGVHNAFAQEADTLKETPVDSLSARLNGLQYQYDYLYCEFHLYQLMTDLKLLSLSVDNSADELLIELYASGYNRELYNVCSDLHESYSEWFENLKENVDVVETDVYLKSLSPDFTGDDINVLLSKFNVIERGIKNVEASLNRFSVIIDQYRKRR